MIRAGQPHEGRKYCTLVAGTGDTEVVMVMTNNGIKNFLRNSIKETFYRSPYL